MYYKMINELARKNYKGPQLTSDNYEQEWFPVWFGACKQLYDQFSAENLPETAVEIKMIAKKSADYADYKLDWID